MADFDFGDVNEDIKHFENAFRFAHLPGSLQNISRPCGQLAKDMVDMVASLNSSADTELAIGLRKLLEAKDAFVRAAAVSQGEGPVTQ